MKREILDHAALVLGREATRTLTARALHARTTAELRVEYGFAAFLDALASRPDRFAIVTEHAPFRDRATIPDARRVEALLVHTGVLRCATVALVEPAPPDQRPTTHTDDVAAALAATLADAHAAVATLLVIERDETSSVIGREAVLELEELRRECGQWIDGDAQSS